MQNSATSSMTALAAIGNGRSLGRRARWLLGSVAVTSLLIGAALPAVSMVSAQASTAKAPVTGVPQGVRLR